MKCARSRAARCASRSIRRAPNPSPVRRDGAAHRRRRQAGVRHQHRLRQPRTDAHPGRQLEALQRNLVLSHSAGGAPRPITWSAWSWCSSPVLARGHSGVRPLIIDALIALVNAEVYPVIPSKLDRSAPWRPAAGAPRARYCWGWAKQPCRNRLSSEMPDELSAEPAPATLSPARTTAPFRPRKVGSLPRAAPSRPWRHSRGPASSP
jgi:hypothetical protein